MRNNEDRLGSVYKHDSAPPQAFTSPQQTQQGAALNFVVPTEFVDLPSKGRFYPKDHPLYGKETLEVKQMTAKEEDILTSKSLIKKGVVLDRLLESIILDKSIKVDDLLVADKNAIVVAARIGGYGPEYETNVTCPSCEAKNKHVFDLLEEIEREEDEKETVQLSDSGTFNVQLPKTGWTVELRALNSKDEKSILRSMESKGKNEKEATLSDQIKRMIVSINTIVDESVIDQAVASLPALDSRYLRKQYFLQVPQVDLKKTFSCTKCDYEGVLEVPITADFFWPK